MKRVVVVGGGIAGLFAAKLLRSKGLEVALVESAPEVGGLLKSFTNSYQQDFDYGTHILRETGVREIDQLLFAELDSAWRAFSVLKTGSVVNGRLTSTSGFMNANHLPDAVRTQGYEELLNLARPQRRYDSALDFVENNFGPTLSQALFTPALIKFFGVHPSQLHESALKQFAMNRIMAFNAEKSRELKKDPWFDERLSFHSYSEGVTGQMNYYPQTGGIGRFVRQYKQSLEDEGVEILCGTKIDKVVVSDGLISELQFSNKNINVQHLVWTLPVAILNKYCQQPLVSGELELRPVGLYYFTFDRPLLSDLYYFMNYDPQFKSFRVTFYQNLKATSEKCFSCCVEVLGELDSLSQLSEATVFSELNALGLVDNKARMLEQQKHLFPKGFPVLTNDYSASSIDAYQQAIEYYKNVSFIGRGSAQAFFTHDVLIDAYKKLSEI